MPACGFRTEPTERSGFEPRLQISHGRFNRFLRLGIESKSAGVAATNAVLQHAPELDLTIHDSTDDPGLPVDARLVRTAKLLQARLLTNDQALCQVARLQQVPALNLADLARALRPTVTAGDELELHLTKEGREAHQAVGYLSDGTMIVVNHARPQLGKTTTVVVSSALQTGAGRLIFAELKGNSPARSVPAERASA